VEYSINYTSTIFVFNLLSNSWPLKLIYIKQVGIPDSIEAAVIFITL